MYFKYFMPTRFLFGAGALNKLHKQTLPGKKALIVISAGKSMRGNGYLARVEEQLEKAGVASVVFDKILPNPIKDHVMEGAALARETGCDFVVGLGGGSSIDSAKSIAVMATNGGDYWDYVGGGSGKEETPAHDPLPIIAITTTAGTGTEADPWTVVTKSDTNEKIGFGYDKTFPFYSVVDPELMRSVPPTLTAYQGFDTLFHNTESYLNINANPISDVLALDAIAHVGKWLATAVADGENMEAREAIALANTEGGFVQSIAGCISEHSLEHAMSAYHPNLPHGAGLILISLGYYGKLIEKGASPERFINMAKALGYDKGDAAKPEDFLEALAELQKKCKVDTLKTSDFGIKRDEFPMFANNARETMGNLFDVTPVELTHDDCVAIFESTK